MEIIKIIRQFKNEVQNLDKYNLEELQNIQKELHKIRVVDVENKIIEEIQKRIVLTEKERQEVKNDVEIMSKYKKGQVVEETLNLIRPLVKKEMVLERYNLLCPNCINASNYIGYNLTKSAKENIETHKEKGNYSLINKYLEGYCRDCKTYIEQWESKDFVFEKVYIKNY